MVWEREALFKRGKLQFSNEYSFIKEKYATLFLGLGKIKTIK
jgi:hypothetical protein